MRNLKFCLAAFRPGAIQLAILVAILGVRTAQAQEDYYVWVDEGGVTNFAEQQPRDTSAEHISETRNFGRRYTNTKDSAPESNSAPDQADDSSVNTGVDPDSLAAEEREALADQIAATKSSNCTIGKRNLAQLQLYSRIRVSDDKGENRLLTNDEKNERTARARKTINENCTG